MGNAFELLELGGLIYTELTLGSTNGFEMWNPEGRGGGKRRGLGPRNDVLTSCKAVTQRGGQRIITPEKQELKRTGRGVRNA